MMKPPSVEFSSVQLLSRVWLFATPWIAGRQASLSITNSRSSLKSRVHRVSDAIQPSHPLSFPSPPAPNPSHHQSLFHLVSPSHEVAKLHVKSFSFSIIPSKEIPGLISFRMHGWISLQSNGLPRVFSNTTVQKHQFFGAQPSSQSNSHIHTWLLEKP